MTFGDRTEVKRAKVGTKVLTFGFAIFAVLGSFWTIVWFIRSYVEPPRVTISPALALAARESTPVATPAKPVPAPTASSESPNRPAQRALAQAPPASAPPPILTAPADQPPAATSLSDRWMPLAPVPAPEPASVAASQPDTTASVP